MVSSKIIIGVTGGVGAGKSTAEKLCCSWGFPTADVDTFVHEILDGSNSVNSAILERFNSEFNCVPLLNNGLIDRKAVAEKAFQYPDFRLFLENLIHPLVKKHALDWINLQKKKRKVYVPLFLSRCCLKVGWIKWLISQLIFLLLLKTEQIGLLKTEAGPKRISMQE